MKSEGCDVAPLPTLPVPAVAPSPASLHPYQDCATLSTVQPVCEERVPVVQSALPLSLEVYTPSVQGVPFG